MVSSGEMSSVSSTVSSSFSDYQACIENLSNAWKGTSYSSIISKADDFVEEYSQAISNQLSAFTDALSAYELYKNAKENYKIAVSNYNLAVQNKDNDAMATFQSQISNYRSKMNTQKEKVISSLQKVTSIKLEAEGVSKSVSVQYSAPTGNTSGGNTKSVTTGGNGGGGTTSRKNMRSSRADKIGNSYPQAASSNQTTTTSSTDLMNSASGDLLCPLGNYRVTSEFGYRGNIGVAGATADHKGIDLGGNPSGTEIYAAKEGTVTAAQWMDGYGYVVFIDHGDGMQTRYAHCSALDVNVGQTVNAGEGIAKIGSTGNSSGPHLHFEIRVDGTPVNPRDYFNF